MYESDWNMSGSNEEIEDTLENYDQSKMIILTYQIITVPVKSLSLA